MRFKQILAGKIGKNAGWIICSKIVQMALSFAVGLITARYLGPSNYGIIGYASAYVTIFYALCTLGFPGPVLKSIIDHPSETGETIGSAIVFRLVSSLMSLSLIALITSIVDRNDFVTIVVVVLYSASIVFQSFDTFRQWFQSKLMSKYDAIASLIAFISSSAFKVYILAGHKDIYWFAVVPAIDYFVLAISLFSFYCKCDGAKLSFSVKKGKELLSSSKSYILSGLMVSIYASTDKLMLKQLMGESAVGFYSLAVTCSTMWGFILSAIIESMNPSIMEYFNTDREKFLRQNKRLYAIVCYVSFIASTILFLIAPFFIRVFYGESYSSSIAPLRITVWYVCFSYLGAARDAWIMCYNHQKYLKYLYFLSALTNVILNCFFIPLWGPSGAALASLFTQISSVCVFPLIFKELRPNVKLMIDAVLLKDVF